MNSDVWAPVISDFVMPIGLPVMHHNRKCGFTVHTGLRPVAPPGGTAEWQQRTLVSDVLTDVSRRHFARACLAKQMAARVLWRVPGRRPARQAWPYRRQVWPEHRGLSQRRGDPRPSWPLRQAHQHVPQHRSELVLYGICTSCPFKLFKFSICHMRKNIKLHYSKYMHCIDFHAV